ncbi:molecular chaperone DnaK [Desulfonema ishimotonii]|uniref:Molecular chaperone DnaK n=1 Tax=Desulfonema ishimotonii TaxID=45657 RepID=A0A401FVS4_9BACT|nr:molecular chaperone DnaK [Desulfonema ishimotonii]
MGKGKKLIAGTLSAELNRQDIEDALLEGFFPIASPQDKKREDLRKGITEFGLPYESEPAITRHMGWFLEQHRADVKQILGRENPSPDLVLFNGGSLKAGVVQERIREALRQWFGIPDERLPRVLENPDPDLAVALGASYYGLVKIGQGVRVGSGSPRSYYLGVTTRDQALSDNGKQAICLVERGLDEGSPIELADKKFEVLTNQPVSFDIYSSSFRSGDRSGDLVTVDDSLSALPPIQTVVRFGKKGQQTRIPVQIEARYTEMGTLALWCRSSVTDHRWQLQFQLRNTDTPADISDGDIFDATVPEAVCEKIGEAFSKQAESRCLDGLVRSITAIVGRPREKWPLQLIRAIADELLKRIAARGLKSSTEARWLNLTGFCLRPGFGDGFDEHRVRKLWKIYKNGPIHASSPQVRSEWWIMWRRIAGGLKPGQQRQFIQDLSPVMLAKKGGGSRVSPQERLEVWMAVANMEKLLVKDKVKWGRQLLSELTPKKSTPQHFWALSRIGAREPLYGPVDRVIPPEEVTRWIQKLTGVSWASAKPVAAALAQMARKTGDRVRDPEAPVSEQVAEWMAENGFSTAYGRQIREVVPIEKQEENTIFGESLPSGIVLHA